MNTRLKQVLVTGLAVIGMGWMAGQAMAASDTMLVSVTPNITWAVTISSAEAGVGYDFGDQVALGATTVSTLSFQLNNGGTISEYFGLSIENSDGGWIATTGGPSADHFRMAALMQDAQPAEGDFTNANNYLANLPWSGNVANHFGQAAKTAATNHKHVWLRLEMPTDLVAGTTAKQTMVLTATSSGS